MFASNSQEFKQKTQGKRNGWRKDALSDGIGGVA